MSDFVLDPRVFISPPYRTCPKCSKAAFGVLSVGREQYTRRCRECWFTETFPFWSTLKKKVIYVDQFAISNMMKAIDVSAKAHSKAAADPFWITLFERLERVCKLQLAICPDSHQHRDESLLSPFFDALKRMYEQLSHGVSFDSKDQIEQRQTHVALQAWLQGQAPTHDLNPEKVTSGGLNEWQDRLIITVSGGYPPDMAETIRSVRDQTHEALAEWFERCRQSPEKDFDHWLNVERQGCADGLIAAYRAWAERQQEVGLGKRPFTLENLLPSPPVNHFIGIRDTLKARGFTGDELGKQIHAFLNSDHFMDTPVNLIVTRLFASIAHRAANGQKRPPNRGMANDIGIVSSLLPYCDAMFIDNECRAMLENVPKKHAIPYATEIFSLRDGEAFLEYLKRIEDGADKQILADVREVYGDDWPTPFLKMYEVEREMEARRQRDA